MVAAAAVPAVARALSRLLLFSSHSSSIGAAQNLSSFTTNLIGRRQTSSLLSIIICNCNPAGFLFSSSYSSTSFTRLPPPIFSSTVCHRAVLIRELISPSPANLKFKMICHRSSPSSNFSSASYSTSLDWTPPLRGSDLLDDIVFIDTEGDNCHWLFLMETDGFEFETEEALFNYYIKTLVRAVGSILQK
ncbi:hypothetical protein AQUCO_00800187v1 [Aquilegia coerulea]|uniref:Uncharacterized protein n=1 Tax=Aquilegia coerulea TaxID=218851 RepID=A0A2G5EHP5_AQUCA|nr:hypothetical protein AQUCO_00800187v1 [Aquilegia coerulea]PIA55293.1 hypothetical protein AQUCO_00800187v1 [Aquilegia coerulea]